MCQSRQIYKRRCTTNCPWFICHACYSDGLINTHIGFSLCLFGNQTLRMLNTVCVCLQTVRDSGAQCVKSLFRNKKELCSVGLELPARDTTRLTEVCLTHTLTHSSSAMFKHFDTDHLLSLSDSFCVSAWSVWRGRCHPAGTFHKLQILIFYWLILGHIFEVRGLLIYHLTHTLMFLCVFFFPRLCYLCRQGCVSSSGRSTFTPWRTTRFCCSKTPAGWWSTRTLGLR